MDPNRSFHPQPSDTQESDMATALTYVRAIQTVLKTDRRRAFASLRDLFRDGDSPEQMLHGRYAGQLLAFDIAPA